MDNEDSKLFINSFYDVYGACKIIKSIIINNKVKQKKLFIYVLNFHHYLANYSKK